jgi:hypothetical protein
MSCPACGTEVTGAARFCPSCSSAVTAGLPTIYHPSFICVENILRTLAYGPVQTLKAIVGAALVGLGFVILFGKLDGPATQLTNLLAAAAREALELLRAPSRCWYHSWPLFRVMPGAA